MHRATKALAILFTTSALLLTSLAVAPIAGGYDKDPLDTKTQGRIFGDNLQPVGDSDASGVGSLGREACFTTGYPPSSDPGGVPGVDKDVSCDDSFPPDNENGMVVHPEDPEIILGGSNDYQLFFNGATVVQRVPAGYFISFDGGDNWIDGQVPMQASYGAGDPSPAFDVKRNRALMASLSFVCGQGAPLCSRGNLAVAYLDLDAARAEFERFRDDPTLSDQEPQLPWQDQMVVKGSASDIAAVQIFSDKEWITVDNNRMIPNPNAGEPGEPAVIDNPNFGNYYLVYARFRSEHGAYDESPIFFTKSEDGGANWTDPVEISGRSTTKCTWQDDPDDTGTTTGDSNESGVAETPDDPNACDQDQFAYPVVGPDGTLYVHFHNEQNSQAYELPQRYDSQIMLVKSDDGGDTWFGELNPAEQTGCVPNPEAAEGQRVLVQPDNPRTRNRNEAVYASCIVPIHIVDLEDSYDDFSEADDAPAGATAIPDYPTNVQGRTTLTNMQFRVNSAGTITIARTGDPEQYRLYVVYADNCAGVRPAAGTYNLPPEDPDDPTTPPNFVPVTDTNLYYAYSDDQGQTWIGGDGRENDRPYNTCGAPGSYGASGRLVMRPGSDEAAAAPSDGDDQFFPWVDAHPVTGETVGASMDGAQFDPGARETYGFTGFVSATTIGTAPDFEGPIEFAGAPSQPRQARFFRTAAVDPDNVCPDCTRFLGDYNAVAIGRDGTIHTMWTDMRRAVCEDPAPPDQDPDLPDCPSAGGLRGEDAYYAQRPVTPMGLSLPVPDLP